jgi:hypothetical protein
MALQNRNVKGQLSNSAGALLTAGSNQTFFIQKITLHNASGSDVANVKLYIYASGGSVLDSTQFIEIGSIADGETQTVNLGNHVLYNGDIMAGVAGTNTAVNYLISYAKRTD